MQKLYCDKIKKDLFYVYLGINGINIFYKHKLK